jgi:hypothetical protein
VQVASGYKEGASWRFGTWVKHTTFLCVQSAADLSKNWIFGVGKSSNIGTKNDRSIFLQLDLPYIPKELIV